MLVSALYMWRQRVKPSHRMFLKVKDQILDLRDDIVLKKCQRVEQVSVFQAPIECRIEILGCHVGVAVQGPIQVFGPRELRHVLRATSSRWGSERDSRGHPEVDYFVQGRFVR